MRPRGLLAATSACVFLSGAASLILEVVWSRLLKLVFGSTTLAITTILVAYMLGLALGGLYGGRLAARVRNGVRAYGWMEVAVGVYALFVPTLLASYPWLNREVLAPLSFWPGAFVRFGLVLVVLLVPTLLMGATLPVLVAALTRERGELSGRVGVLYGLNTLGAMTGVLVGTFVLFGAVGVRHTNLVGALLDVAAGLLAVFLLAPQLRATEGEEGRSEEKGAANGNPSEPERSLGASPRRVGARDGSGVSATPDTRRWNPTLLTYGLVGFSALALEVCWTRALAMVFGSSVYAFATILAGFLAGIGLGSLLLRRGFERVHSARLAYALAVACVGLAGLGTMTLFGALPDVFLALVERSGMSGRGLVLFGFVASFTCMLPTTLVLGALFPLATQAAAEGGRSSWSSTVADVYFINTVGAATGAFAAGFLLLPKLGIRATVASILSLDLVLAALLLWRLRASRSVLIYIGAPVCLLAALAIWVRPPSWDAEALAQGVYYRPEARLDFDLPALPLEGAPAEEMLFFREGINATVSIHRPAGGLEEGGISLRINGKTDASLSDMSTQVLSAHIPLLFGAPAAKALVIGYASGVTTGSATLYDVDQIDVAEIEPAILEASHYFDDANLRPLEDDRVRLIVDDGRIWLTRTEELYDIIISEPSNPWITGCSNLFTAEFFELVRQRLEPDGRLLQWMQLYGMRPADVRSVLAALFQSFDYAYGFLADAGSTDLLLLASNEPLRAQELPTWEALPDSIQDDLRRVGYHGTADLWSLFVLGSDDLRQLAGEARTVNTDDSMFVELDAPWHVYDDTPETSLLILERGRGLGGHFDAEDLAWGPLAVAYLARRDLASLAQDCATRAGAQGDRAHLAAYEALAMIRADPERGLDALARLDEAVAADPQAFTPRFERAFLRCQAQLYEQGLADIEILRQIDPEHLEVRHLRAKTLAVLERHAEARAEFEALVASPLAELDPHVWAEAAFLAPPLGKFEAAAQELRTYLELAPYSPREWSMLAQVYEHQGEERLRAQAETNASIARRNQIREIHRAARWQARFTSVEEALETIDFVLRMAPDYEPALADQLRWRAANTGH